MSGLTGSGFQTDTDTKVVVNTSNGDHDRFAHYAPKDEITYAIINGTEITALCGKTWVPAHDPVGLTICPPCKQIYGYLNE
jgi:hypothetical protein